MTRTDLFHRIVASIAEWFTATSPHVLPVAADAAIKGAIVLALVALATLAMRGSSAAARHLAWFAGTLSLLLLPVVSLLVPGWHVLPSWTAPAAITVARPLPTEDVADTPSQQDLKTNGTQIHQTESATPPFVSRPESTTMPSTAPPVAPVTAASPSTGLFTWQAVSLLIWLAGTAVLLGQIALGLLSLGWLRHRSARITGGQMLAAVHEIAAELGVRRRIELLTSSRRAMPMIWGFWRIRVLLPAEAADWSAEQSRVVLLHELAHARRFDCLTQFVAQLACALFWFNPLVWLARWRMQIDREQACDDLVLASGTKASAYAEQLVRIAAQMPTPHYSAAAIAMARPSTLESRVRAILDPTRNRRRLATTAAVLLTATVGLCAVALASLRAAENLDKDSQLAASRWAERHGWESQLAKATGADSFGNSNEPPSSFNEAEEADARACIVLANRALYRTDNEPLFSDPTTRAAIEEILKRRPNYFYAEFVLAVWHRRHGDAAEASRLLDAAYQHAPAVFVERYQLPGGAPLEDTKISAITLSCSVPPRRNGDHTTYSSLPLSLADFRTDAVGNIYVPAYPNLDRVGGSPPDGYELSDSPTGSFKTSKKVAVLPAVTVAPKPGDFAPTAGADEPTNSSANLPDGNSVELLVVNPSPNPKNEFWRPDGSPSAEHYPTGDEPGIKPWPENGRRFVFRFKKSVPSDWNFSLRFSAPKGASNHPSDFGGQKPDRPFVAFATFPTRPRSVSIQFGVASGAWKVLQEYDPSSGVNGDKSAGFTFKNLRPTDDGGAEITLIHAPTDLETRVVAIDSDHREYRNVPWFVNVTSHYDHGVVTSIEERIRFEKLPLQSVVSFRLEMRKYQWAEFSNVVIDPEKPKQSTPLSARELPPPLGFGRVVDTQNRPIAGAKLSQKQLKWSATSDASGLFRLPKPGGPRQYGQFDLTAAAPGFVSRDWVMFRFVPKGSLLTPNTPDISAAPKLGDDGIIRLQRLGRVEGIVLGPDGKPLPKAPVELDVRDDFESMTSMIGGAGHAITDANGRFTMNKVPPGDLLIFYPGGNGRPPVIGIATALAAKLADGQTLRNVVLDLSKSTAIAAGQVLDKNGEPVAGANVALQWRTDTGWGSVASMFQVKTADDGRYRLEKLPQGTWAISATIGHTNGDPVAVTLSGNMPAHLDLVLPVVHAPSGRIRRVPPMDQQATPQEWIDATLAGDTEGAAAVVAPGSPFARNGGRLAPLLKQISRFTSSSVSGENVMASATTNTLDLGGGPHGSIKFKMIRQGDAWLINDAVDENGKSLVGDDASIQTPHVQVNGSPPTRPQNGPIDPAGKKISAPAVSPGTGTKSWTIIRTTSPRVELPQSAIRDYKTLQEIRQAGKQDDVRYLDLWLMPEFRTSNSSHDPKDNQHESRFRFLEEFRNLEGLKADYLLLEDKDLDAIGHCHNLKTLSLCGIQIIGTLISDSHMRASQLRYLSQLKNLETLDLSQADFSAGVKYLAQLPNLHTLILASFEHVDDASVAQLKQLSHLQTLVLAAVYSQKGGKWTVTDAGLASLKELPNLRSLYVEYHGKWTMPVEKLRSLLPKVDVQRGFVEETTSDPEFAPPTMTFKPLNSNERVALPPRGNK